MAGECSWCGGYIGDRVWWHTVTEKGKDYKSVERFCSQKCSYEYPYDAKTDKPYRLPWWFVAIVIIVLYLFDSGYFD